MKKITINLFFCIILFVYTCNVFSQSREDFISVPKSKYSTLNHPKANGLNISFEYPSTFIQKEGERTHVVQKFLYNQLDKIQISIMLIIKELPDDIKNIKIEKELFDEFADKFVKTGLPYNSKLISSENSFIDGEPANICTYSTNMERLGFSISTFTYQCFLFFRGNGIFLQCSIGGAKENNYQIKNIFNQYKTLFTIVCNSLVLHDKWLDYHYDDNNNDYINDDYLILSLIISLILTWCIGLIPPLIIRYIILRKPTKKNIAIIISVIFLLLNLVFFTAIDSESKTHAALVLVAYVSYRILIKGHKIKQKLELSKNKNQLISGFKTAIENQSYNEALKFINDLIKLDNSKASYFYNRAMLYNRMKNFKSCYTNLETASEKGNIKSKELLSKIRNKSKQYIIKNKNVDINKITWKDYCPFCIYFDSNIFVCSKLQINVSSNPHHFSNECNGDLFILDHSKKNSVATEEEISQVKTNIKKQNKISRKLLAIIVIIFEFFIYLLIGAALGWKHGGGMLPMMAFMGLVTFTWKKITKSDVAKHYNQS